MLKEEVADAVKAGKFHVYPVKTIDEGIEILAGVKAGARRPDGTFEEGTVNYRVDKRLKEMAEKIKEYPEFVVGGRKNRKRVNARGRFLSSTNSVENMSKKQKTQK